MMALSHLLAFVLLVLQLLPAAEAAKKPNFLILFLDDHGWGDLGANANSVPADQMPPFPVGSWKDPTTGKYTPETPHMDALAASGIRFTDFHVGFSVCTPSRAALLTGRLCPRTGVCSNFGPYSRHGMATQERTVADILGESGYEPHMIGKWHLGHNNDFHPTYRGFKTYLGLPYSGDMGCLDSTPQACKPSYSRTRGQPACPALCPKDDQQSYEGLAKNDLPAGQRAGDGSNEPVAIPLFDSSGPRCSGHVNCSQDISQQPFDPFALNHRYAERAAAIFARFKPGSGVDAGKPFLLYVAFAHTHTPLAYQAQWENSSTRPGYHQVWGNTMAEVDNAVGEIHMSLESNGLADDTLILLTADNGPADLGSVDCDDIGSAGPFLGGWQKAADGGGGGSTWKGTEWEGGHHVVGLASWKGMIKPGQVSDALVSSLDYLPTLASLAGVSLPSDRAYDGMDITDVLLHGAKTAHETLFHPHGFVDGGVENSVPAMRMGKYKAHFITMGSKSCYGKDGKPRTGEAHNIKHDPPLVFDISTDPGENHPLDPSAISAEISRMKQLYAAFWHSVNTTLRTEGGAIGGHGGDPENKNHTMQGRCVDPATCTSYDNDPAYSPCSNRESSCCRFPGQKPQPPPMPPALAPIF